jgi:hypothetical protein
MGQNPAAVNTQNVYTYINSMIVFPTWQVNGNGQILSYTQNGSTYQATIQWNTAGSGVVTFKDGSTTKATLTVTITATPVAPIVTSGERCGPGTVTLSAIPQQGGNAIKWYDDENTSSGTIGMTFTTPTITITKKYYATTYNTATGAESQPRTPVWATVKTLPPSPTILNDKRIGPGTLDLASVGGGACQWFSAQGVLLNTSPNYMTPVINSSTANYMYAKTFGSNGCASAGQTWINVVVDPKPKPVVSSNRIVMGTTVSLDAG